MMVKAAYNGMASTLRLADTSRLGAQTQRL